jgi:hypothetical protein
VRAAVIALRSALFAAVFVITESQVWVDAVEKVFTGNKRIFLKPLMRFVRRDVRDHIVS